MTFISVLLKSLTSLSVLKFFKSWHVLGSMTDYLLKCIHYVYALMTQSMEEEIETFYYRQDNIKVQCNLEEITIFMGDQYTKVGKRKNIMNMEKNGSNSRSKQASSSQYKNSRMSKMIIDKPGEETKNKICYIKWFKNSVLHAQVLTVEATILQ